MLDLTLDKNHQEELLRIQELALNLARPKSQQLKQQYVKKESTKLIKQGVPEWDAQKIIEKRANHYLVSSHVLFGKTCGQITVEEMMNNPQAYEHEIFLDPLEEERSTEYRATLLQCPKSKSDSTLVYKLRSFRHGGTFYTLEYYSPAEKQQLAELDDFINRLIEKYIHPNRQTEDEIVSDTQLEDTPTFKYTLASADDWAAAAQAPTYIVESILETDSHGILAGASMAYKTFVALKLAHCICTGTPFMGYEVYNQGKVLLVCGEGKGGLQRRLRALIITYGSFLGNLEILEQSIRIDHEEDMCELNKMIRYHKPALVIFDTFASLVVNTDENSPSSVGPTLRLIKETCRNNHTASMIIHHYGKDAIRGMRGASNFTNDVDFSFSLKRKEASKITTMECMKMKDGENFQNINMMAEIVPLGIIGQNNKEMTGLVIVEAKDVPVDKADKTKALTGRTKDVYQSLIKCIAKKGVPVTPEFIEIANNQNCSFSGAIVHIGLWREEYYDNFTKRPTDPADVNERQKELNRVKKAFDRGFKNIVENQLILVHENYCVLCT